MNEVPGMNIINKFADILGMPVVNLNIRMCLFVFAPEKQLVIGEFAGLKITAGQRTMSGLIEALTGQTFDSPVMSTGQN